MTHTQREKIRSIGNGIIAEYMRGFIDYNKLQNMYAALESVGITTGIITGDCKTCEWYYNGVKMPDSMFVYSVYKINTDIGIRLDITCYLS